VSPGEYQAFVQKNSAALRDRYYSLVLQNLQQSNAAAFAALPEDYREKWDQDHPLGWLEHRQAWDPAWNPKAKFGLWVLGHQVAIQINDTLFVHGGISGNYCQNSLKSMTDKVVGGLKRFDPRNAGILEDEYGPLWYRGLAAAHSLQYDEAIADFRSLLDRQVRKTERDQLVHVPLRDNEYRFMLASLHHMAGHADSAIALYQQALEHDLGLVMAHTYLASIYEGAGRAADAMVERRRAAEVDSDDPTALFDLAASFFNTGQLVEADEPLRRAIKLNDRYSPSYYLLGRVTEELGLPEEARGHFQKFLALAPLSAGDLRADAEQRLTKLK